MCAVYQCLEKTAIKFPNRQYKISLISKRKHGACIHSSLFGYVPVCDKFGKENTSLQSHQLSTLVFTYSTSWFIKHRLPEIIIDIGLKNQHEWIMATNRVPSSFRITSKLFLKLPYCWASTRSPASIIWGSGYFQIKKGMEHAGEVNLPKAGGRFCPSWWYPFPWAQGSTLKIPLPLQRARSCFNF